MAVERAPVDRVLAGLGALAAAAVAIVWGLVAAIWATVMLGEVCFESGPCPHSAVEKVVAGAEAGLALVGIAAAAFVVVQGVRCAVVGRSAAGVPRAVAAMLVCLIVWGAILLGALADLA